MNAYSVYNKLLRGDPFAMKFNCLSTIIIYSIDAVLPLPQKSPRLISTCDTQSYTCSSGECISVSHVCDGVKDCEDNSDEGGRCGNYMPITTLVCIVVIFRKRDQGKSNFPEFSMIGPYCL